MIWFQKQLNSWIRRFWVKVPKKRLRPTKNARYANTRGRNSWMRGSEGNGSPVRRAEEQKHLEPRDIGCVPPALPTQLRYPSVLRRMINQPEAMRPARNWSLQLRTMVNGRP